MKKFLNWLFKSKVPTNDIQTSTAYDEYEVLLGGIRYRSDERGQFHPVSKDRLTKSLN